MFFHISKIMQALASPVAVCLALMIAAVLAVSRRTARLLMIAAAVILLVLSSPYVSTVLIHSLEDQYPDLPVAASPNAQAIVLLGGAMHTPGLNHNHSALLDPSDRILHAFRLYEAGKAPLIVISGGNSLGGPPEAKFMAQLLAEWGLPPAALLIEGRSLTTRENAVYTRELLQPRGISRILLVTSAMHMPRAAALFRKVGFTVIAAPADFLTGWQPPDVLSSLVPNGRAIEESRRTLREWIGYLVYRWRGWC